MNIYNEIADMNCNKILEKFKKSNTMESALICFIKGKGNSLLGGSAEVICQKPDCVSDKPLQK